MLYWPYKLNQLKLKELLHDGLEKTLFCLFLLNATFLVLRFIEIHVILSRHISIILIAFTFMQQQLMKIYIGYESTLNWSKMKKYVSIVLITWNNANRWFWNYTNKLMLLMLAITYWNNQTVRDGELKCLES